MWSSTASKASLKRRSPVANSMPAAAEHPYGSAGLEIIILSERRARGTIGMFARSRFEVTPAPPGRVAQALREDRIESRIDGRCVCQDSHRASRRQRCRPRHSRSVLCAPGRCRRRPGTAGDMSYSGSHPCRSPRRAASRVPSELHPGDRARHCQIQEYWCRRSRVRSRCGLRTARRVTKPAVML